MRFQPNIFPFWPDTGECGGVRCYFTRNNKTKIHQGIDLAAPLGTPVYAMYSGRISYTYTSCINDEKKDPKFGNEIRIKVQDGGKTFYLQYAHLNYGTPIAINPRTGMPFAKNDEVYQGDLIGYTGSTGNAFNVPNKHLHLGVIVDGQWVNPDTYINGSINTETINATMGHIDAIICETGQGSNTETNKH